MTQFAQLPASVPQWAHVDVSVGWHPLARAHGYQGRHLHAVGHHSRHGGGYGGIFGAWHLCFHVRNAIECGAFRKVPSLVAV
jgi:hypothetical protein